jgi:hypothetical protein
MDTPRVHAHDHDDDTVEAHYACLERPCACLEGWVFVGYIDEYGEERSPEVEETVFLGWGPSIAGLRPLSWLSR